MITMKITPKLYTEYLKNVYKKIHSQEEYITALDSATGDGDHWSNLNKGFTELNQMSDELAEKSFSDQFKKIGTTMMSVIGGSSGVLYGGAYLAAAKTVFDKETLDKEDLYKVLEAMLQNIMERGKTEPGWKTMVDALYPAVEQFKESLKTDEDEKILLQKVAQAAVKGAEDTKDMEAVRGRATYQANKGVGHLDPGAVTMAYQVEILCKTILDSSKEGGESYK